MRPHGRADAKSMIIASKPLYDASMQPKGSALFRKIGYAPLHDYLNNPNEKDRSDARSVLSYYAYVALEEMYKEVIRTEMGRGTSGSEKESTLIMVGHAIYLPAVALALGSLVQCTPLDIFLSANTNEAEGYLLDLGSSTASYLKRPSTN